MGPLSSLAVLGVESTGRRKQECGVVYIILHMPSNMHLNCQSTVYSTPCSNVAFFHAQVAVLCLLLCMHTKRARIQAEHEDRKCLVCSALV